MMSRVFWIRDIKSHFDKPGVFTQPPALKNEARIVQASFDQVNSRGIKSLRLFRDPIRQDRLLALTVPPSSEYKQDLGMRERAPFFVRS